jgi:chromosome segregation ATPase
MSDLPERIFASPPDIFDGMSIWEDKPTDGKTVEYVRADLFAAKDAEYQTLEALYLRCNNDCIAAYAERDRLKSDNAAKDAEIARLRQVGHDQAARWDNLRDAHRAAEALVADCAEYLKDGETPRQRMDRDHADVLSLMAMLAKDRQERDDARAEIARLRREVAAAEAAALERAEKAEAEVARCHARLEIDHEWRLVDGVETRVEIPIEDRAAAYDAVSCRDATIELLEDKIASLFRSLDAALAKLDGGKP